MTDEQKVRADFEAYCGRIGLYFRRTSDGERYVNKPTQDAWITWQAALFHASATAEECSVGGEAVAWLEVEPGISFERAVSEHGMLIHSMLLHVGRRKPTKRQDANGLFPLFGHPPRAAEDARDAERYRWLRDNSVSQWEHPIVVSQTRTEYGMRYVGPVCGRALDRSIDEAIAGKRGEK